MALKRGRFENLSRKEALRVLDELEGPLLELLLGQNSRDVTSGDVPAEVLLHLFCDPRLGPLLLNRDELDSWETFKLEHGDGCAEIGEFVYGPEENPWR